MHGGSAWFFERKGPRCWRTQALGITVPESIDAARVDALVRSLSSDAKRTYALGGLYKYDVPCKDISLSEIFKRVASWQSEDLPIVDWAVHSASLEDVFIGLATAAEAAKSDPGAHAI